MQKKLFLSYIIICIFALGISIWLFWSKGYSFLDRQGEENHLLQANLLGEVFKEKDVKESQDYIEFAREYSKKYKVRITIIDQEGNVRADSDKEEELENHGTRQEVIKALNGDEATVNRYSKTMGEVYSYSAVPLRTEYFQGVLRISLPYSELKGLRSELVASLVFSTLVCLVLAIGIAGIFTKRIISPITDVTMAAERISKGEYGTKIYTRDQNQIGRLAMAFNEMADNLATTMNKLTRRKNQLEAMLSSMNSGVVAIDDNNNILFHNQAFLEITHTDDTPLVQMHLYEVVRNALIFEAVDVVRNSGKDIVKEGFFTATEGEGDKLIRVSATPLVGEQDTGLGVLLIIEDITQIRKLEHMRTDFVSNVTHELKTPLTSIRGFIDTLKNGAIREEKVARKFLDIIDIESERLFSLIQDILILSEIESKRDYEKVPVDIKECVESVVELLESKVPEGVEILYHVEENTLGYPCNPDRMKQLFINLLDNAIKYTEKGKIMVVCNQEKEDLFIQIRDTGIGMEEQHLPRIFERFYRVDRGRSRKQGGTGLGLSIVKHIVELYGGKIGVESKVNVGTVFEIRLPY